MLFGLSLAATTGTPGHAELRAAVNPREVVERAFENLYGYSSVLTVTIRAREAGSTEFTRVAQVLRRGGGDGLNRLLVRFTDPPDLRGIGVLLHERSDFTYDAFLYQPLYKMVRRVSVAQRADAFFGTDLYFEDLEAKRASQWNPELLRTDHIDGRPVWVIRLVPEGFPSGYESLVAWFDQELPVMLRTEFYRGGDRIKVLDVDPTGILERDGYFIPLELVFTTVRNSTTTVALSEIEIRDSIPDERFTRSELEFGREGSAFRER